MPAHVARQVRQLGQRLPEKGRSPLGIAETRAVIREGHGNIEVAQLVRARFQEARTTHRSVAYYRAHMRKAGEDIPIRIVRKVTWE